MLTDSEMKTLMKSRGYGHPPDQEPLLAPVMNFDNPNPPLSYTGEPAVANPDVLLLPVMNFELADSGPQRHATGIGPQHGYSTAMPPYNAAGGHSGGQDVLPLPAFSW